MRCTVCIRVRQSDDLTGDEWLIDYIQNSGALLLSHAWYLSELVLGRLKDLRNRSVHCAQHLHVRLVDSRHAGEQVRDHRSSVGRVDALADEVARLVLVHFARLNVATTLLERPAHNENELSLEAQLRQCDQLH